MHHSEAIVRESGDASLAETVVSGRFGDLDPRRAALCRYAVHLTIAPAALGRTDLDPLRAAGLDDRAIVDVNQVVSYFNYVNRVADGLGVELETHWPEGLRVHRNYPLAGRRGGFPTISAGSIPWLTVEQMREIDRLMVEEYRIDLSRMMENAGRNLAVLARALLGGTVRDKRIMVLTGPGGNGGGGLVAARHLANAGAIVGISLGKPPEGTAPVTAEQLAIVRALGISVSLESPGKDQCDLVIDALLGYSQRGVPRARFAELITWSKGHRVLALDVPSGLESSTGDLHDPHVLAEATLTLALPKATLRGAPEAVGDLYLGDISVPATAFGRIGISFASPFAEGPIVRVK
ncbi:MAG: NAD(P)H-hydrate epimerase [candidate division NC10 bacterium]|nr:NAD(P)H-hydrate epimerase [candidate division NC10 bacterium]